MKGEKTKECFIQASVRGVVGVNPSLRISFAWFVENLGHTNIGEPRDASHVLFGAAVRTGSAERRPGPRQQLPYGSHP
jgi:hypothetical protein